MNSELKNQTLVAAEAAKQMGFENTYAALLEIVKELQPPEDYARSTIILSMTKTALQPSSTYFYFSLTNPVHLRVALKKGPQL